MNKWDMDVAAARKECGGDIKRHQSAIDGCGKRTLAHAYCIGVELKRIKEQTPHGKWTKWTRDNAGFDRPQAARYIQFAILRDTNQTASLDAVSDLKSAIKALSPPKPKRERKTEAAQAKVKQQTDEARPANSPPVQCKLPFEMDDELASIASGGDDLAKVITLIRHDELWIDPARARKTIAKEIIKLYQRLQQLAG